MSLLKLFHGQFLPSLEEALVETSLDDWLKNPQAHADATAIVISNDAPLSEIRCDLSGFDVIILDFPTFKDGRAYSQARLLRERFNYTGEIRARGDVLRDQIAFMVRCGVNAVELKGVHAGDAEAALKDFTYYYQTSADGAAPVWRKRLKRAVAA